MQRRILLCDCLGSQSIDAETIAKATGARARPPARALCMEDLDLVARELAAGGELVIACAQEARRFADLAEELGLDAPPCIDIRDRAGWTDDGDAAPKMAALIAEALLPVPADKAIDVESAGSCLILGPARLSLPAAEQLAETLAVTVLLDPAEADELPLTRRHEVIVGRLAQATGTLGRFEVQIDGFRQLVPGGRGGFGLTAPRDGAESGCDIILDLSGRPPLFPAPHKRDGYLRADPGDGNAVARAVLAAVQHVGTFEKPLHVRLEPSLCAHSRAGQPGCTRCLNACPTGAITPDGDSVAVDPLVCAGCGACSALCPSGAISYDAPPVSALIERMRVLAETFAKAGGRAPKLLVHDPEHGAEMIALAARFGRGLPADVLPLATATLAGFGHAEMLVALTSGFVRVDLLLAPGADRETIAFEAGLARAMGGADRIRLLDLADPDALCATLHEAGAEAAEAAAPPRVLALGSRRQMARLAATALLDGAAAVPLPAGAPYGAVNVDTGACTLCLACVSLCPSGALMDNPDLPQLRFQEEACLQCGLCAAACPERAITLEPRFDPTPAALSSRILNEEEPFCCIECGKPFGVKSTIERILERLAGRHPMYPDSAAGRAIQMCDDCRVRAQFARQDSPFASGERPRPRTTEDYLSKRRDH